MRTVLILSFNVSVILIVVINSAFAFGGYLWIFKKFVFNPSIEDLTEQDISKSNNYIYNALFVLISITILILGVFPSQIIDLIENVIT